MSLLFGESFAVTCPNCGDVGAVEGMEDIANSTLSINGSDTRSAIEPTDILECQQCRVTFTISYEIV